VSSIDTATVDGQTTWQVRVTDDELAKSRLLQLVLDDQHLLIAEFRRVNHELEDVFVEIIGKGKNGEQ
jgi:hypothetical protein